MSAAITRRGALAAAAAALGLAAGVAPGLARPRRRRSR